MKTLLAASSGVTAAGLAFSYIPSWQQCAVFAAAMTVYALVNTLIGMHIQRDLRGES